MTLNDATRAQVAAADPHVSTWLSANAGSGKTRVLTDRVARLLLSQVPPQRILCLTYTKAAASEMQNRLFARLGAWAMMPDDQLTASLSDMGVPPDDLSPETLAEARRLFAKAIETPGGLKIQTIHSFCSALLRRFPLEAQVSPAFSEIDDRSAKILRADILEDMAREVPATVQSFARHFSGESTEGLLAEITRRRVRFHQPLTEQDLRDALQIPEGVETQADLLSLVFEGDERDLISRVGPILAAQSPTMVGLAERLATLNFDTPGMADFELLKTCFLMDSGTKPEAKFKSVPTKNARDALEADLAPFQALMQRVADARAAELALGAMTRTRALHDFAQDFLPRLEQTKQARGLLDFDDQILKARALLTDPDVAAWVLFRLDGGIDHILVDEAQDTSPDQWDVVQLLAQEFTAGLGARTDIARTIFVVGDQKQSIYSFQGADPDAFEQMRSHFESALQSVGQALNRRDLLYSFRSAKPILKLVDTIFTAERAKAMGDEIKHIAFKSDLPGRVDLWPWVPKADKDEDRNWYDPVDLVGRNNEAVVLARQIAAFIKDRLAHGQITQQIRKDGRDVLETRAIEPKDFLILVQGRSRSHGLFHEIIRACKAAELPMAGTDRLRVGGELGVRDLVALLSYLVTPEDDLSLATVLRSPIGGLSEAELHSLAQGRSGYLRQALEERQDEFPDVYAMLRDLRDMADFLRPYDLLERALTRHGGRAKLRARLGDEVEEGIAALLDQAMSFERSAIPGLTAFLTWLGADDVTIKRQLDARDNSIRVMTIHGAKGLEAPIVILPDTAPRKSQIRDDLFPLHLEDGRQSVLWKTNSDQAPLAQTRIADEIRARQSEENMRLLYVAATRAENWLIVCGAGEIGKDVDASWYQIIEDGMTRAGAHEPASDTVALRLDEGAWPDDAVNTPTELSEPAAVQPWMTATAPAAKRDPATLSPSDLGGAKALSGPSPLGEEDAMARGTALHLLLENLPSARRETWHDMATQLLSDYVSPLGEDLLRVAQHVLDAPDLGFLFAPETLAEVEITAQLTELDGHRISGKIDRMVVQPERVLAVDFKSNITVPDHAGDVPEGFLRQMGAYGAALAQIYPDRRIETAILWTETAQLMTLPHDIVRSALQRSVYLDARGADT